MKGNRGGLLGALLLVAASTIPARTAQAQIFPGTYVLLHSDGGTGSGSSATIGKLLVMEGASPDADLQRWLLYSTYGWPAGAHPEQTIPVGGLAALASSASLPGVVGVLRVPPYDDTTLAYEEHWLLFPEYRDALDDGERVTIVPLDVSESIADKWMDAAAARDDVTYRHVIAQREELSHAADEDEAGNPCDVSEAEPRSEFRGIWQRKSSTADVARLVGFVRRSSTGRDTGEEQWCLTGEYTYPSIGGSTITELRSAALEELTQVVTEIRETRPGSAAPHGIRVETTDRFRGVDWRGLGKPIAPLRSTAIGATQAHACNVGRGERSPLWCFVAGFVGIAFSLRRAQQRRPGSGR